MLDFQHFLRVDFVFRFLLVVLYLVFFFVLFVCLFGFRFVWFLCSLWFDISIHALGLGCYLTVFFLVFQKKLENSILINYTLTLIILYSISKLPKAPIIGSSTGEIAEVDENILSSIEGSFSLLL